VTLGESSDFLHQSTPAASMAACFVQWLKVSRMLRRNSSCGTSISVPSHLRIRDMLAPGRVLPLSRCTPLGSGLKK